MLSIPNGLVKFAEAVLLRVMIFLLCYLSYEFARMFISFSAYSHPYMAMWADILFEATVIIILNLQYGHDSVGRDINVLKFYIVLIHLAYLPFYFFGIDASMLHNNGVKVLNLLILFRLFYFGKSDLLSRVSIIQNSKKWLFDDKFFLNSYVNGLTIFVFFLCAIPLCTLIFIVNTDQMRVTGIAIILFAFFFAFDVAKRRAEVESEAIESIAAKLPKNEDGLFDGEGFNVFQLKSNLKILGVLFIVLLVVFPLTVSRRQETFFNLGYASGFSDAKSGVAPKKEADFQKALWCTAYANAGLPLPPNNRCFDGK